MPLLNSDPAIKMYPTICSPPSSPELLESVNNVFAKPTTNTPTKAKLLPNI